ncbi:hypothetical protein CJ030_MR5G003637 [Morella rubra]|uniref:Uncharacterized protein n=1 Tax=Morella rubra TaxID=262757 RepID=A0A6A1VKP5_9ROSI|nr:hypothetical protein CJ030_MR5G003637 [Morella rubra]
MGQGQEVKTKPEPQVEIQGSRVFKVKNELLLQLHQVFEVVVGKREKFFFYRPKVDKEEVHSVDDVQRLYIVMRPESGEGPVEEKQDPDSGKKEVNFEEKPLFRLMVIDKKRLPDPSKKGEP